jgi:hypothetical protein
MVAVPIAGSRTIERLEHIIQVLRECDGVDTTL